jgi:hypothetical protein
MTDERPRPAYGEERPRPAYGEYATPEQQAAAMGKQYVPPPDPATIVSAPAPYGGLSGVSVAPAAPSRRWDFFLSALLLVYGLYSVISGLFQYSDLDAVANRYFQAQGIGTFTSTTPHLATALGLIVNASDIVIFLLVAWITVRLLRRGRIAFYVPLIGGILAGLLVGTCLVVLMLSDPSFIAYFKGLASGA